MRLSRGYHNFRLALIRSSAKRADYLRKHHILSEVGANCRWGPRSVPLYPELIKLHDNVTVHKTVKIMSHDDVNDFLMRAKPDVDLGACDSLGSIEIMDNVYIGIGSMILPDVKINKNCIVSAGSVVVSDVPENSVVAGNPAKVIGKFDMYLAMRRMNKGQNQKFKNQELPPDLAEKQWQRFEAKRQNTVG